MRSLYGVVALVVITQLADVITSLVDMARGYVEKNPFVHSPIDLILMKYVTIVVVVGAVCAAWDLSPRIFRWTASAVIFMSGVTFAAVIGNLRP